MDGERVRHAFGIVPQELLDDETALQEWLADEAHAEGLALLLVGLRVCKTFDVENDPSRTKRIAVTVAEGFCVRSDERRLPHVTYHDMNAGPDWPD